MSQAFASDRVSPIVAWSKSQAVVSDVLDQLSDTWQGQSLDTNAVVELGYLQLVRTYRNGS